MKQVSIIRHLFAGLLLAATSIAPMAQTKSRIAVVGDLDRLLIGQSGYCGERADVPRADWARVYVEGGQRTWFRIQGAPSFNLRCVGEFSFLPKPAMAYIIRYTLLSSQCRFELFRVVPGGDPVREQLTQEAPQVCLLK